MAERVHPASKPSVQPQKPIAAPLNSQSPGTKPPPYVAARPNYYRPQLPPRRHRRNRCCTCCLWLTLLIVIFLALAALSGVAFWVLYRPHRPIFSVHALRIYQFNVTSSSNIDFKSDLTIKARNPNKKLRFDYDPFAVSILSKDTQIGRGSVHGFLQTTKNATLLRSRVLGKGKGVDDAFARSVRSDLKERRGLPLTVRIDTRVGVKIGGMKTKKMRIRVLCGGIRAKSATTVKIFGEKCDVDLRIKIWRWTF